MTPEERFNQQVWEILQDVKEESLATKQGQPVKHRTPHIQGAGIIPKERRIDILFKLQEWGILRVRDNPFEPPIPADDEIYLDLIQPKFDEIYSLYENGSSYQEEVKENPATAPQNPPIIKSKTLELIALDVGDLDTGTSLINFLIDCGVDRNLVEYPQLSLRETVPRKN